jgi:hypothetical protein
MQKLLEALREEVGELRRMVLTAHVADGEASESLEPPDIASQQQATASGSHEIQLSRRSSSQPDLAAFESRLAALEGAVGGAGLRVGETPGLYEATAAVNPEVGAHQLCLYMSPHSDVGMASWVRWHPLAQQLVDGPSWELT